MLGPSPYMGGTQQCIRMPGRPGVWGVQHSGLCWYACLAGTGLARASGCMCCCCGQQVGQQEVEGRQQEGSEGVLPAAWAPCQ